MVQRLCRSPQKDASVVARPFLVSIGLLLLVGACAHVARHVPDAVAVAPRGRLRALAGENDGEAAACHEVHQATDQCAFVRLFCRDGEAGLLPYLTFFYCTLDQARPVALAVLALWLGLLFSTIGIAASDFFSVNLSTIAGVLGLSESLAGATFLAFGNGSPDVFSTFAAMGSRSGSMAVGELIGAASFISAVVAGSMALVREFKVGRRTFVRDICFYIAAVAFTMGFLADGMLQLWECCVMIGFYVFYVGTVVGWHWCSKRQQGRRTREAVSRHHVYGSARQGTLEPAPYRDGPGDNDDDDAGPAGCADAAPDAETGTMGGVEQRQRADVHGGPYTPPLSLHEDEQRGRQMTAEMTSSMRLSRARHSWSATTITPIRPSLLGALEFRSFLSSLSKERNLGLQRLSVSQMRTAGLAVPSDESQLEHARWVAIAARDTGPWRGTSLPPSPLFVTPRQETDQALPPSSPQRRDSRCTLRHFAGDPRPVGWWPSGILPPPHVLLGTLFPTLQSWTEKSIWNKMVSLVSVPSIFVLVATLPVVETERAGHAADHFAKRMNSALPEHAAPVVEAPGEAALRRETEWQEYRRRTGTGRSPVLLSPPLLEAAGWNRWLVFVQIFMGPLFVVSIVWANMLNEMEDPVKSLARALLASLVFSLCLLAALLLTTTPHKKPKYHFVFCFLGFVISVAWISTVAGEVVGVLKAFGVILGISEAILGLTIFAVGNSLGDLVADATVARLGHPVMALSACFGGPMLNILLGVGLGGAWMAVSSARQRHEKHPDNPLLYRPYEIQVSGTLIVSAITVLFTLVFLLVAVPANKWVMSRRIGWALIALWTVSTVVNLVLELTGVWAAYPAVAM